MKKVFVFLAAIAAVLFTSCDIEVKDELEIFIDNKSDFDLSNVNYLGKSIASIPKSSSAPLILDKEGSGAVTFEFIPQGETSTMSCKVDDNFTVAERYRKITINNSTVVVDVSDNTNSGVLSQITVSPNSNKIVTFDPDGGTVSPTSLTVSPGGTISVLPIPTKTNNTFGGWFTQPGGGGTEFTTSTAVTSNITVYANWTAVGGPGITNINYSKATWTLQGDGRRRSPAIGHSDETITRCNFTSTGTNATLNIALYVSSEYGYDYAFIGGLDSLVTKATAAASNKISGSTSRVFTITVPTAGSHYIEIGYGKDAYGISNSDCAWFTVE